MVLLAIVAFIFVFVSLHKLNKRVDELSVKLEQSKQLQATTYTHKPSQPQNVTTNQTVLPIPRPPIRPDIYVTSAEAVPPPNPTLTPNTVANIQTANSHQPETPQEFFLWQWFKEQTLIKVGSIIFFFGAVWFVSYAIEQNWVPPLLRITLGILLAFTIYGIGHIRKKHEVIQYQVLSTLGTAILLGTVIASQFAFTSPVLQPESAFYLMVTSIAYTLFVAVRTNTEWLGIASGVTGLLVPFLVNINDPSPVLLLSYLLILTGGILVVVFMTSWRTTSLVMLVGASLHLLSFYESSAVGSVTLWIFVVLFSILFCTSTTTSIIRSGRPNIFDVLTLTIVSFQFIIYAANLALAPELAVFIAATVTAIIGYFLRRREAHADAVSIYLAMSLVSILVGTTMLFDGFVLTIALSVEILAVYIMSLKLATVERSVVIGAALFLLPLASGLGDLTEPVWKKGVFHPEALGTLIVLTTLGFAVIWTLRTPKLQAIGRLRKIAAALLIGWYLFALAASGVVSDAFLPVINSGFIATILLSALAVLVIGFVLSVVKRTSWQISVLLTLIAPIISATALFSDQAWNDGVGHSPFFATLLVLIGLSVSILVYWRLGTKNNQIKIISWAYVLAWVTLLYSFMFFYNVSDALLTGDMKRIATAISYVFLVYLLASVLMLLKANAKRIVATLFALMIPGTYLIESLQPDGWVDGILSVDAIGLYVVVTALFLLGTSFIQHASEQIEAAEKLIMTKAGAVLYWIAGITIFLLVWMMSQSVFTVEAVSITVALFIYTVSGLAAYSYGRAVEVNHWKRIGVILLALVVIRLALVDFWVMDRAWQVVTFLGVGSLFIATALLERSRDGKKIQKESKSEE